MAIPLSTLKKLLGPSVRTDRESCFAASYDSAKLSFLPEAVIFPKDEEAIGNVLALANQHRVPITTRGGGTAATGAASPVKGGWVIDLHDWQAIEINSVAGYATVQPGVKVAEVQEAAERNGWFYPPDPSSFRYATIGGTIATNAGGLRAAKYGVTRDHIYALEGFLPTGERVNWGLPVKKFASGYNIRDLWIGSEGTLGIVTKAVLKLIPRPPVRKTFLVHFSSNRSALEAAKALLGMRLVPAILEFLDTQSLECVHRRFGFGNLPIEVGGALLLVEVDGIQEVVAGEADNIRRWAASHALDFQEAKDREEAEALWEIRRRCSPAMFECGDTKLNEDIVVPLESYTALIDFVHELHKTTGLATPTFGHAADGNFHVHLMFHRDNDDERKRAQEGLQALMEKVVSLGGAISGEHGIGLAKSAFFELQHRPAEIATMRAIKRTFDPNNILNPGKIFEPFPVWECTPADVHFPWDHKKDG